MSWMSCKQFATTFPTACTMGTDASTILLVNRTTVKSDNVDLAVTWPNGITSHYDLNDVQKYHVNNLYEPTVRNEPMSLAPEAVNPPRVSQVVSPNPFNPTTNISFNLPEAANVELKVYNLMGQEVATLISGSLTAGNHRVIFDAHALPSGLYFSRLTTGSSSMMTRMLLMK